MFQQLNTQIWIYLNCYIWIAVIFYYINGKLFDVDIITILPETAEVYPEMSTASWRNINQKLTEP